MSFTYNPMSIPGSATAWKTVFSEDLLDEGKNAQQWALSNLQAMVPGALGSKTCYIRAAVGNSRSVLMETEGAGSEISILLKPGENRTLTTSPDMEDKYFERLYLYLPPGCGVSFAFN